MSIVTFQFWNFVIIITVIYFLLPKKWQWLVILCGNIIFYASVGVKYIGMIGVMSLVSYLAAIKLEESSNVAQKVLPMLDDEGKKELKKSILSIRQYICAIAIILVAGVWGILKYSNFFIRNYNSIVTWINESWKVSEVAWILPLGISFYIFHIIGYVVDVYRGKYPAERNFAKYFTFVTYFPHMIQGPFSRFDLLGKSILHQHTFSYDRLCNGCARILWGLFKKLLVADKLGVVVNTIFNDYTSYSGIYIIFAIFSYCIELYADFSGYMDMVCGLSSIWGIELSENFRRPYFAKTIDEFWRRWHITLGAWFKDYVFYPVSMGKIGQKLGKLARKKWGARVGKLVPGYFALIFVWTATGLWHGASWSYLVWGYLNLLVIMSTMQLADFYEKLKKKCHIKNENIIWRFFCIIRTFTLVCFFRFFSTQPSLREALSTLKHTFMNLTIGEDFSLVNLFVGMESKDIWTVIFGTTLLIGVDVLQELEVWEKIKKGCPMLIRNIVFASIIMLIVLLSGGSSDLTGGFMYANF